MAIDTRENLKKHFQTGDIPTQGNYTDLIDSPFSMADQNSGSLHMTGSVIITGSNTISKNNIFDVSAHQINLRVSQSTSNGIFSNSPFSFSIIGATGITSLAPWYHYGDYNINGGDLNILYNTSTFVNSGSSKFHGDIDVNIISASLISMRSGSTVGGYSHFPFIEWDPTDNTKALHFGSHLGANMKEINYYAAEHRFMNNAPVIIGSDGSDDSGGTAQLVVNKHSAGNGNLYVSKHITASGNISASGTSNVAQIFIQANQFGTVYTSDQKYVTLGDTSKTTMLWGQPNGGIRIGDPTLNQVVHVTASGNISSSGTIIADNFTSTGGDDNGINFTDGVNITGNITSSGNMQITGNISASGDIEGKYRRAISTITTNTTLNSSHAGTYLRCNSKIITIPANSSVAFPIGTEVELIQKSSTGHILIQSQSNSVTLNSRHQLFSSSGQFSAISCKKVATDEWDIIGDLTK